MGCTVMLCVRKDTGTSRNDPVLTWVKLHRPCSASIESFVSFALVSWFGSLSLQDRNSLSQIIKWAGRPLGEAQFTVTAFCDEQLECKAGSVAHDHSLLLRERELNLLPSDCHLVAPTGRTK